MTVTTEGPTFSTRSASASSAQTGAVAAVSTKEDSAVVFASLLTSVRWFVSNSNFESSIGYPVRLDRRQNRNAEWRTVFGNVKSF